MLFKPTSFQFVSRLVWLALVGVLLTGMYVAIVGYLSSIHPLLQHPLRSVSVRSERFDSNPIIKPGMANLPGENINGPSLIRVPEWITNPLGKYYLYFAAHKGQYIRMAYADNLTGPWIIYTPGVLHKKQTVCTNHIASPDVHVDHTKHVILMYFHGPFEGNGQFTFLSHSFDGLQFKAQTLPLGPFYFAVFKHNGWFYTVTRKNGSGTLFRSKDAATPFEEGLELIPSMRHSAPKVDGNSLWLFYTKIGGAPESIEVVGIDLSKDWQQWPSSKSTSQLVLKPEKGYEGIELPVVASTLGESKTAEHALRDPAIFEEEGHTYLIYALAGERGLGIAELFFK